MDVYLAVVAVGLVVAIVEQVFLQRFIAGITNWGYAPGWQREIALWNVAMLVAVVSMLWSDDADGRRIITGALVTLMALLGTNHLVEHGSTTRSWGHGAAALINYTGCVAGIAVLWY